MTREFLILGKKKCHFTEKVIDAIEKKGYQFKVRWSNIDFQNKEFKDMFGEDATYPQVYEIMKNGKKKFLGGSDTTIPKL